MRAPNFLLLSFSPLSQVFEDELKKAQLPLPHVIAPEFHPLDGPSFLPTNELFQVRRQLAGSLGMLSTMVQPPAESLMGASFSVSEVLEYLEAEFQLF